VIARLLKSAWTWWLCVLGGLLYILGNIVLRRRHDEEAGRAEAEADKVKEAGKRGDADAVLDSFRRSTDK
jgi:hypothetical protein